ARARQVLRGAAAGSARGRRGPLRSLLAAGRAQAPLARDRAGRDRAGAQGAAAEAEASPGRGVMAASNGAAPLLEVEHVKLHFPIKHGILVDRVVGAVHAVDDLTFTLVEGETLGL